MARLVRTLVVLTLAVTGCQFPKYAVWNICFESSRCVDEYKEDRDIERMAAAAWVEAGAVAAANHGPILDLQAGFMSGFTYYVKRGGDGEPPPVPPSSYWKESYRSAEGHAQVQAWFDGYRMGTRAAREGRYRERQTLLLSRPLTENYGHDAYTDGITAPGAGPERTTPSEMLPAPTPMTKAPAK